MPTENLAPDADSAAGGWTTNSGGTTSLFAAIDESTASDTDYIRSPTRSAAAADLIVRLKQGATTIATWTHNTIGTTYVDAVQTLTAPQLAAISDFNNLLIEFDDNAGAVYRATLANPSGALTTPVTVSYRYKAESVTSGSAEAAAFLARTTGLDGTHTAAYQALIDGMVADGVWNKLDVLYIFASQTQTNALLNLKSASYTATITGTVTFTADRGFTNPVSGTDYVNTHFNASTAGGNYTQDSAHFMSWQVADLGNMGVVLGADGGTRMYHAPNYGAGGTTLSRINTNGGVSGAVANGAGMALTNRSSSSNAEAYRNATQIVSGADASVTINNSNFTVPSLFLTDANSTVMAGCSMGGSLSSGDVTAFYNRLRTYMTAVGVP